MDDFQSPVPNSNDSQRADYVDADVPPIKVRLVLILILTVTGFITFLLCAGGPIALFFSIPAYKLANTDRQAIVSGNAPFDDLKWINAALGASRIITGASIGMSGIWIFCIVAVWYRG